MIVGRIIWWRKVPNPSRMLTNPWAGRMVQSTANFETNMKPSQNPGTENPRTAKIIMEWSHHVPCFQAAMTPRGTPRKTANVSVVMARKMVGSMRWAIKVVTGLLTSREVPRSPVAMFPDQIRNCVCSGLSSPSDSRSCWISPGVASSSARISAGSPGVRWMRRKTNTPTTIITGIAAKQRRTM